MAGIVPIFGATAASASPSKLLANHFERIVVIRPNLTSRCLAGTAIYMLERSIKEPIK